MVDVKGYKGYGRYKEYKSYTRDTVCSPPQVQDVGLIDTAMSAMLRDRRNLESNVEG